LTALPLFINGFHSLSGRTEFNLQGKYDLSSKWATSVFVHANKLSRPNDNNNDGFLDLPLSEQLNVLSRLQYIDAEKGWVGFIS
jgi:hypothetical protein